MLSMVETYPTFAASGVQEIVEAALKAYLLDGDETRGIVGLSSGPLFSVEGGSLPFSDYATVYFQSDEKPATAAVECVRQDASGSDVPTFGMLSGLHREEVWRYLLRTSATGGDGQANLSDEARRQDALLCDYVFNMLEGFRGKDALLELGLRRAQARKQGESEGASGFQNAVQLDFVVIVDESV